MLRIKPEGFERVVLDGARFDTSSDDEFPREGITQPGQWFIACGRVDWTIELAELVVTMFPSNDHGGWAVVIETGEGDGFPHPVDVDVTSGSPVVSIDVPAGTRVQLTEGAS